MIFQTGSEIMRQMRHSDYRLTMNTYTDERQLAGYELLTALPRLEVLRGV